MCTQYLYSKYIIVTFRRFEVRTVLCTHLNFNLNFNLTVSRIQVTRFHMCARHLEVWNTSGYPVRLLSRTCFCTDTLCELLSTSHERWNSLLFPHGIMSCHLTDAITESAPLVYLETSGVRARYAGPSLWVGHFMHTSPERVNASVERVHTSVEHVYTPRWAHTRFQVCMCTIDTHTSACACWSWARAYFNWACAHPSWACARLPVSMCMVNTYTSAHARFSWACGRFSLACAHFSWVCARFQLSICTLPVEQVHTFSWAYAHFTWYIYIYIYTHCTHQHMHVLIEHVHVSFEHVHITFEHVHTPVEHTHAFRLTNHISKFKA